MILGFVFDLPTCFVLPCAGPAGVGCTSRGSSPALHRPLGNVVVHSRSAVPDCAVEHAYPCARPARRVQKGR